MALFAFPHGIPCVVPSVWAEMLSEEALRLSIDLDAGCPVYVVTDRGEHPDRALQAEQNWLALLNVALTGIYHDGWNPMECEATAWVKHCWLMAQNLEKLAGVLPCWAWDAKAVASGHAAWYRGQIGAVASQLPAVA